MAPKCGSTCTVRYQKDCEIRPARLESILKFFDWADREHQIVSISDPLFSALLCGDTIAPDPSGSSSIRITQDGSIYPSTYLLFEEFLMGNIRDFHLDTDIPGNPAPTGYYMHRFHLPVKNVRRYSDAGAVFWTADISGIKTLRREILTVLPNIRSYSVITIPIKKPLLRSTTVICRHFSLKIKEANL